METKAFPALVKRAKRMYSVLHAEVNSNVTPSFFGPVAQLDSASDYESEGYKFESCQGHFFKRKYAEKQLFAFFYCCFAPLMPDEILLGHVDVRCQEVSRYLWHTSLAEFGKR